MKYLNIAIGAGVFALAAVPVQAEDVTQKQAMFFYPAATQCKQQFRTITTGCNALFFFATKNTYDTIEFVDGPPMANHSGLTYLTEQAKTAVKVSNGKTVWTQPVGGVVITASDAQQHEVKEVLASGVCTMVFGNEGEKSTFTCEATTENGQFTSSFVSDGHQPRSRIMD